MINKYLFFILFFLLKLTFWGNTQTINDLPKEVIFINEIHYDNSGADSNEGIELAGTAGTNLDGWSLVLYNGNNSSIYKTVNLSGTFTDQSGGYGFISFSISGIQNGSPDGIALVNNNAEVIQFLSYEGTITALDGPAVGLVSEDIGQEETGSTLSTESLQLVGSGSVFTDFTWSIPSVSTFGAINNNQIFEGAIAKSSIVFFNEIHYDNVSTDSNEGIELAGTVGAVIDGWSLVFYNGGNGSVYKTIDLNGTFTDQSDGYGFIYFSISGIQNGSPDGIALINENAEVIQFISYEGTLTAIDGPAVGLVSEDIGQEETGSTLSTESLQLIGSGKNVSDFTWRAPSVNTFGQVNNNQFFGEVIEEIEENPEGISLIHNIQGTEEISPLIGKLVTIEGVVVGDYQSGQGIFFVQEEDIDMDSNDLSSEGILVSTSEFEVNKGDLVEVTGRVVENFGNTELQAITNVTIISTDNILPKSATVSLPFSTSDFPEKFEGMLIKIPQTLTVTNTESLSVFGEVSLSSGGRLFQPTQLVSPGESAISLQAENDLNQIILDDANSSRNPESVIFPQGELSFSNTLRAGSEVINIEGCMSYAFSSYRVYVEQSPEFIDANPRTLSPNDVGGNFKIASFNVLNYFNGNGNGGGFPTARGADSEEEFIRQRDKIINAIVAIDADVLGLVEIENDGYDEQSAIQDLVNGINEAIGSETYTFVNPDIPQIGTDEIAVGFIYKLETVSLVGGSQILDSSVDSNFIDTSNRPSLAQTFKYNFSDEVITISVNHFKSKGSGCDRLGDPDINDGQGNCNLTRLSAANALTNWLSTDPTGSGSSNFLIIGDLNAYANEDPITAIKNAGYTNLVNNFEDANSYSYQFNGQFGTLDYALASEALVAKITGITDWHINSDEPEILDYNQEVKNDIQQTIFYSTEAYRASDHDPVVVGVEFPVTTDKPEELTFLITPNVINRGEQIEIKYNTKLSNTGLRFRLFNRVTGEREWGFNDYLAPTYGEDIIINRDMWAMPGIYIVQYFNPFTEEIFGTSSLVIMSEQ